jgi:Uncharacterized conserved protein
MGKLVGSFATSHVVMNPAGVEAQAQEVIDGFTKIGKRIAEAAPDVIIYITSDHMVNLRYALQPAFALGCAYSYTPLGDMDIPREPIAGAAEFSDRLLRFTDGAGFDLARAEDLTPDHGIALPLRIINPGGSIPISPLLININRMPPPSPARCFELGQAIGRYIASEACTEKVAIVGAGGLSHWIAVPGMGRVNEAFDRDVMDALRRGDLKTLADMPLEYIQENGGNGGLEIMCWLTAAAASGFSGGNIYYYQPMTTWFTGMGAMEFCVN